MRELRIEKLSKHLSLYSSPMFTSGYVKLLCKPSIVFQTDSDILVSNISKRSASVSSGFETREN